jgi:hypothetical protein
MPKRSDNFPLVLAGFVFGFAYLFKTMFEGLLYTWVLKQLERHLGLLEAEVLAKLSDIGVAFFASGALVWFLYRYMANSFRHEFENIPKLSLSYAADATVKHSNGTIQTFIRVKNEARNDISGAQVKIEEAVVKKNGSDTWENTSILSRTNMSWGQEPDGGAQKYSTIQLAPGKGDILDFLTGPLFPSGHPVVFKIRVDPKHKGINPFFSHIGTYRFVLQASALNAEPKQLTIFADWDGGKLVIRDGSRILETTEVLKA